MTPHRELFTLPPITQTEDSVPAAQELPVQKVVTGDNEVDAVLWLREVISTGQPGPIATALEAAKKIRTPLEELGKRYSDHILRTTGNVIAAAFTSFGFEGLEELANRSVGKARRRAEALSRFPGQAIWNDTPAESFCVDALKRCRGFRNYIDYDKEQVAKRFRNHPDLMPQSLSDCLYELDYWQQLYWLRHSFDGAGDGSNQAIAREWFVRDLLGQIAPATYEEALRVLKWIEEHADQFDGDEYKMFANLLRHPGALEAKA